MPGLDCQELATALHFVKQWRAKLDEEADASPDAATDDGFDIDAVDSFVSLMESRLSATKASTHFLFLTRQLTVSHGMGFSSIDTKILARADIVYAGDLSAKDPSTLAIRERIAQENAAGAEHLMPAQNLHTKLDFLLQHTIHHASARLWIESFLFRITAMIQTDKQLVIGLEVFAAPEVITTTPPTIAIGGHVDYLLFFVDKRAAPRMLDAVNLESALRNKAQAVPGLFVAEAKGVSHMLGTHVPQAVVEMQACASRLKSTYIRGALTNGTSWIFLLLELDTSFLGGRYWESARQDVVIQSSGDRRWVDKESVDRMAALLAHWAKHCAEDLTEDDWFEKLL
ncbi:hypothetical protein VTO73DRAFT_7549 [Trametes versicolor]